VAESFRESGHLPKQRPDSQPPDPAGLPRQRRGTTPQMHGRYPDYDVLEQARHWDPVTREVVQARIDDVPSRSFFTRAEFTTLCAFSDIVLAQEAEPRVPVMSFVDAKLAAGQLDGFQHVGMPDDRDTWRLVARGLDEAAERRAGTGFASASEDAQREVVGDFADGSLSGGVWEELDPATAWTVVMRAVLAAFYAHPWAWNEIGFAGPAYPRGHMRLATADPAEGREAFDIDPVVDVQRRGMP
jgi:hypothetical protein